MNKIILLFFVVAASGSLHAQTVQCQTANGAWGPCPFVSPVATVQILNKVSTGTGTSLPGTFASTTTAGNSILCIAFESAAAAPGIADGTNTYIVASSSATAPGYTVALASNIAGGSVTVTETTSSGSAAFSCYELKGTVSVGQTWDYVNAQQATSGTLAFAPQTAAMPNEMAFVALGTTGGTVTPTPFGIAGALSGLTTVDQANITVVGNVGLTIFYSAHASVTSVPSFTQSVPLSGSTKYSAVLVSVKPISMNEISNVSLIGGNPVTTVANGTQQVGVADASGNGITSNSTTYTSKRALDTNFLGTLGTAFSTPGKIDITPLPTGTNIIGKAGIVGNTGATLDSTVGAGSAPSNGLAIIGQFNNNSSVPAPSNNQTLAVQLGPNGSLLVQPYRRSQILTKGLQITNDNTAHTIFSAQGAGVYVDITSLVITTKSSMTSTPFTATISDGGGNSYVFDLNPNDAVGVNVISITFNPPLLGSANSVWSQTNSSSTVTTDTTVVGVVQTNF